VEENKIANKKERAKHILRYNAMPGISRHHWGTELDFISTKVEFWETEKGQKVYNWLKENAYKYGFYQPYTNKKDNNRDGFNEEKWHWSYFPLSNEYLKRYKTDINYSNFPKFLGGDILESYK
jgi:D-alanyl-D-alanine carboxypeptidase